MKKYARYGPPDRYPSPPAAGMCLSVFALVKRNKKLLVGVPVQHNRWQSEWVPQFQSYSKEELAEVYSKTRLPSAYLLEGEHPKDSLSRVMRDQLGMERYSASSPRVVSYTSPSDWYPGNSHWDLAFLYEVKTSEAPKKLPWWQDLSFLGKAELRRRDFGWNQDMMKDLGYV
ncbi:MAG: hypothetical protein OK456_06895 [Thaumarchaeota archaeon]|nr:hypothetical protein [Nitrososphaerota archaeon]